MSKEISFRKWLWLYEALDPATKASLEKADARRFPDREFLKKAIEDMEREAEVIPARDAWRRLNSLAASGGRGASKEDAALAKLAAIMPRGTDAVEPHIQMWRGGRMSLPELYSLAFFAARGVQRNALDALARDMTGLPDNWRKRINFSDRPEISTNDGVSKFDDVGDFSSAVHALGSEDLDMSGKLEFDPRTDIRPERHKDLVLQGNGIWVYKGTDPTMCRLYGKGGRSRSAPAESPWCVAQTSNAHHYFDYRVDRDQTFFFIFDTNKRADDPARRVLAGVSSHGREDEWGDMENKRTINGHSDVRDYKRYLAGKLGMSVQELDQNMSPEPVTDAEKRLKQYIDDYANASRGRSVKKDEIWESLKNDKNTVYGKSMLEMFLVATDVVESRHYEELPKGMRKLARPAVRLLATSDPEEARAAIKEDREFRRAPNLRDSLDHIVQSDGIEEKWRVLLVIAESLGDELKDWQFGKLLDEAAHLGIKDFVEGLTSLPLFSSMVQEGLEDHLWNSISLAKWEKHHEIARIITNKIADQTILNSLLYGRMSPNDGHRISRARMARDAAERGMWNALEFLSSLNRMRSRDRYRILIAAVEEINPEAVRLAILHGEGDPVEALRRIATIRHHQGSDEAQKNMLEIARMIIDAIRPKTHIDPAIAKSAEFNKNHEVAEMIRDAIPAKEEHWQ